MGTEIEIILIIVTIVISFFAIFGVFTTVQTGTMKFAIKGEEWTKTIYANTNRFFLWKLFGLHLVGFWILNDGIKKFTVNTDKANPKMTTGDSKTWVLEGPPKVVDNLLEKIPRILVIPSMELGDETLPVDLAFALVFEVIKETDIDGKDGGVRFVFDYKAEFTLLLDLVKGSLSPKIANFKKYQDLVQAEEKAFDELTEENSNLNDSLYKFGLRLIKIRKIDQATDKSVEEASRKKTIAELNSKATRIDADAKAYAIKAENTAEIEGLVAMAKQQLPNASDETIMKKVFELMEKKELAKAPGLQTLITDLIKK